MYRYDYEMYLESQRSVPFPLVFEISVCLKFLFSSLHLFLLRLIPFSRLLHVSNLFTGSGRVSSSRRRSPSFYPPLPPSSCPFVT
jgi:hypothetical protein